MTLETNKPASDAGPIPDNPQRTPSLPDLATRIRVGHSAVIEAKKNIVRKAIEVGGWLKQAKDSPEMKHGMWLPWLKANCADLSERTAQRYMELADNKEDLEELLKLKSAAMADLTLSGALELLQTPPPGATEPGEDQDAEEETEPENDQDEAETSDKASDEYDKAEEKLIQRLKNLNPDEAEAAISTTIRKLRDIVVTMKKAAAAVEKKAA